MTYQRWDNPTPMPCSSARRVSSTLADHLGAREANCGDPAAYVRVDSTGASAGFRCLRCAQDETGRVAP